jgi:hypothetical protein
MHTTVMEMTAIIPGVVAVLVGVVEMRSDATFADKVRRLFHVALAVTLVAIFFLLGREIDALASSTIWLAGFMTALAVVVGLSGALIGYSRRSNAILMALSGFMLAYYWAVFSLPRT